MDHVVCCILCTAAECEVGFVRLTLVSSRPHPADGHFRVRTFDISLCIN